MSTRCRFLLTCGSAALALALAPASQAASSREEVRLSGPRVSAVGGGVHVVTLEAAGDIRGLLTLTLEAGGGSVSGEWVLVSRYIFDTGSGSEELGPTAHDGTEHEESIAFRERGTLHGRVSGGTLAFDSEGRLAAIDGLQLAIGNGDLEFAGSAGTGSGSASNLQDPRSGSGLLVVAREVTR